MTDPNTLFLGRPDYIGPVTGHFGLLHHDQLFEHSENAMERVQYVKKEKPAHEIEIRLHNMIYLDPTACPAVAKCAPLDVDYLAKLAPLDADYEAKCAPLLADYEAKRAPLRVDYLAKLAPLDVDYEAKRALLRADYEAKRAPLDAEILTYIRTHIPDCTWDGTQLVFPT